MTLGDFVDSEPVPDEESESEEERVVPRLQPLEGGEVTYQRRGTIGHLHHIMDENAVAYGCTKDPEEHLYFKKNGYAISTALFDILKERVDELRGDQLPIDAGPIYLLFFIQNKQNILRFSLDQYINDGEPLNHTGDEQHVIPLSDAIEKMDGGLRHVVRDSDLFHGYISK